MHRKARVGIIATGDELVEPGQRPGPSQIRNSNSYQLYTQVLAAHADAAYYGIGKDTEEAMDSALKQAARENDVVLFSGGVSKGDFDFVPAVMRRNGVDILFDSIAMKPGKPTTFGVSPDIHCFGLPGNPVSTFIQFEILVKPFLHRLMGHEFRERFSILPAATRIVAKRNEREMWLPVRITADGGVEPVEYHGSAHLNALSHADGLIVIPAGSGAIEKGTPLRVRSLP